MKHVLPWAILIAACLRPSEGHVELDALVGQATEAGATLVVADGLGAIRSLSADRAVIWSASPVLELDVVPGTTPFALEVRNLPADAVLELDGEPVVVVASPRPTVKQWTLDAGGHVRIAPPDAFTPGPHRVAVLSDIQDAVDEVQDIFDRMNADPTIRFVLSTGDLTNNGRLGQLVRIQEELELLDVPLYSTVGNHEVPGPEHWHDLFGPFNSYFEYRGVAYSLVDSSNATVDPTELTRLRAWVDSHVEQPHLFLTHVPIFDDAGLRSGSFRSRNEAARLVNLLAEGEVDALFFGHVHSYYAYGLGGIDAYISGGGGAIEEELDGIGRHYLTVDLDPAIGVEAVGLVRID
ncbi:MAG: metallophosphoesterase [Sandaracinus sp.]|nr:metallophosphoesterase [Myxococcales bacterium]MCB9613821.1 metallophosphoesterase [Sandaracinus sp.]